jgi:hypothetical protein
LYVSTQKIDAATLSGCGARAAVAAKHQDVGQTQAAGVDAGRLVLTRPDQRVAWRGDRAPDDPVALTARVEGAEPEGMMPDHRAALGKVATGFPRDEHQASARKIMRKRQRSLF